MLSKLSFTHLKAAQAARLACHTRDYSEYHKSRFKIVGQSLGDRWKLHDLKTGDLSFLFHFLTSLI
uniref:Uncharacterized protein n=1 Tax=Cannabis sativa TaxID=3483 RepID=A0A803R3S4_CANSA